MKCPTSMIVFPVDQHRLDRTIFFSFVNQTNKSTTYNQKIFSHDEFMMYKFLFSFYTNQLFFFFFLFFFPKQTFIHSFTDKYQSLPSRWSTHIDNRTNRLFLVTPIWVFTWKSNYSRHFDERTMDTEFSRSEISLIKLQIRTQSRIRATPVTYRRATEAGVWIKASMRVESLPRIEM